MSSSSIEIRLFKRTSRPEAKGENNQEYHVGDFGDAKCIIDLSQCTFFVFTNRQDPNHKTLLIRERKQKEDHVNHSIFSQED